jgi:hypothetical protein
MNVAQRARRGASYAPTGRNEAPCEMNFRLVTFGLLRSSRSDPFSFELALVAALRMLMSWGVRDFESGASTSSTTPAKVRD